MTHRNVETLIGRLATDPLLRRRFADSRATVLREFQELGYELTAIEADALAAIDPEAIRSFSDFIDPRIRKADSRSARRTVMPYDPFRRGPHPVGVRTESIRDRDLADHPIPIELWYPAASAHRGSDLDAATRDRFLVAHGLPEAGQNAVRDAAATRGEFPLFLYCHGGYGHRREATAFCTHLASHGYVVCAADFPGDNINDLIGDGAGSAKVVSTPIDESAARRPGQASRFIDHILAMDLPAGLRIQADLIGTSGMSMGGFTSLALNSVDRRPKAAFPMCPMHGERSLSPQVRRLQPLLHVDDWRRPVATCVLTGEVDPLVNVEDMRSLYRRLPAPKRLVVLERAGHMHFADGAAFVHERFRLGYLSGEFSDPELRGEAGIALGRAMRPFAELCTEAQSGGTARALCLAHMDSSLKGNGDATAFLEGDLAHAFAGLGVTLDVASETTVHTLNI